MLPSLLSITLEAQRPWQRALHVIFPPKWKKNYIDDGYPLGLAMRTLEVNHVIDVGAAASKFARSIRANSFICQITSFEPLQVSYSRLVALARRDKFWTVFRRSALGRSTKLMSINRSENNDSSSLLSVTKKSIQAAPGSVQFKQEVVQVYALDDIFNDIARTDDAILLKLDVQGFEEKVIRGARQSLSRVKGALIECSIVPLYEGQAAYLGIISIMSGLGFEPFAFFKGFCNEITGEALQLDILFLNQSLA